MIVILYTHVRVQFHYFKYVYCTRTCYRHSTPRASGPSANNSANPTRRVETLGYPVPETGLTNNLPNMGQDGDGSRRIGLNLAAQTASYSSVPEGDNMQIPNCYPCSLQQEPSSGPPGDNSGVGSLPSSRPSQTQDDSEFLVINSVDPK